MSYPYARRTYTRTIRLDLFYIPVENFSGRFLEISPTEFVLTRYTSMHTILTTSTADNLERKPLDLKNVDWE